MTKFIFSPDKHVGFQRKNGKLHPLHDMKAINALLKFGADFKPDVWIEGGDNIDCGPVSHWLKHKKVSQQELNLAKDCRIYRKDVLDPIDKIMSGKKKKWMRGNHEEWLTQFAEENPGMEEIVDPINLLHLDGWDVVESGGIVKLGKLHFVHGDQIGNTKYVADRAVQLYGHPVVFGHFHTHQTSAKYELVDVDQVKMGLAVPGLCNKNPNYMEGKPNAWMKGFAYGYIHDDGSFQIYVPIMIGGKFAAEGKVYRG